MTKTDLTPAEVLERKEAFGRTASYRILAERTGLPQTTIFAVLTEKDTRIPISDDKVSEVVAKSAKALDEIEASHKEAV